MVKIWEDFPQGQYIEAVFCTDRGCTSHWYPNSVMCRGPPGGNGLKACRGHAEQQRLGTVWQAWSPGRKPRWGSVKAQPLYSGASGTLEMPVWDDHQERQHRGRGTNLSLKLTLCVLSRAEPEKWLRAFWRNPEECGWIPETGQLGFALIWLWLCPGPFFLS